MVGGRGTGGNRGAERIGDRRENERLSEKMEIGKMVNDCRLM